MGGTAEEAMPRAWDCIPDLLDVDGQPKTSRQRCSEGDERSTHECRIGG